MLPTRSSIARAALGGLCEAYWYPVYAMVRRYGHDPTNAEDLTQAYFTRFLEKSWVKEVSPEHGRFRSFLLVSVRNFLNNETARRRAIKRGGGQRIVELDGVTAERRYALEPVESSTPETLFERSWAEHVLARTSSGGVCVNGTILHLLSPELPFGGVGPSGMGTYHGRFSFETFSHKKSVLSRGLRFDPKLMYPPYSNLKTRLLKKFL